jgi:hypothetical protein
MTSVIWRGVARAARLLESEEREVVLGDLLEANAGAWCGLLEVAGLVIRRQLALWRSWRPWLAGPGLAFPLSWTLMGISVSVSWSLQHFFGSRILAGSTPEMPDRLLSFLCQTVLLLGCSWAGGFVVGAISGRTLWASAMLCLSPCIFCLSRFRIESLSRLCLLVFLVPAIHGVRHGLASLRIGPRAAIALAVVVTLAMVISWAIGNLWILEWVLIWPVWYLVATAVERDLEGC